MAAIFDINTVIAEVRPTGFVKVTKHNERHFNFTLQGKKRLWNIGIILTEDFPFVLPKLRLNDHELIGKLPHVNQDGIICLIESDSLLVDFSRPVDVITQALDDAVSLLERGSLGIYRDDLLDELEGYFQPDCWVYSDYSTSDRPEIISLRVAKSKDRNGPEHFTPLFLSGKYCQLSNTFSNHKKLDAFQSIKALHLPFEEALLPPEGRSNLDAAYLLAAIRTLSAEHRKRLNKLIQKSKRQKVFWILISMPRTSGERSQFLLKCRCSEGQKHTLDFNSADNWQVTSYGIKRLNPEYLLERGGAEKSLQQYHVAIIGCGSVGGEIATMLTKAGIGKLTLIDGDSFEADNLYRHRLGGSALSFVPNEKGVLRRWNKAEIIAYHLKYEMPFVETEAVPKDFDHRNTDLKLDTYDMIVVAVGSPSISLQINSQLKKAACDAVVYCWNEAASCGGHAILVDLNLSCLECLYSSADGIEPTSLLSLVEPDQHIAKNLTGCGGSFTPFSYLDSSKTASLATQLTVDHLLHEQEPCGLSWKNENRSQLKVTKRHATMHMQEKISLNKNPYCRICNG